MPPPVDVGSTVGAGDALVAGAVAGILRGLDLEARARLASAFAAGAILQGDRRLPSSDVLATLAVQVDIAAKPIPHADV